VVKLQRPLHGVDEAANVLPPAAGGVVGRNLDLLGLFVRQYGVTPQAGNESRGAALHQIDLGSEARFLRHLLMPPPYLDFLTAELLGDDLRDAGREPLR